MRTGTVSVNCRSNDGPYQRIRHMSRNISNDGASRTRIAADRLFSAHFLVICSAVTQKPKVQDQHGAR